MMVNMVGKYLLVREKHIGEREREREGEPQERRCGEYRQEVQVFEIVYYNSILYCMYV